MTPLAPSATWLLDDELAMLFAALNAAGETRFIGGCVRDGVLGLAHSDIDLATSSLPQAAMEAAQAAGIRTVPTGIAHGTFTAVLRRGPVEVTTLRRDVETDGRHAVVAFTADWRADAARRDFTINALSCGADGKIFDYFDGMADLAAGRVRFIGKAADRIAEDYLRALRFFRFTARYGKGEPDAIALAAIKQSAAKMGQLSGERVQSELLKLLAGPRAAEMWRAMIDAGVIGAVLTQEKTNVWLLERVIAVELRHDMIDGFRRFIAVTTYAFDDQAEFEPIRPKSFVRHNHLKGNEDLFAESLKFSNAQWQRLMDIYYPGRLAIFRKENYGKALYRIADPRSLLDIAVLDAAATGSDDRLNGLIAFLKTWVEPKFPLSGDSLLELGLQPGPIFGELLREVETWWIARDFRPSREECLAELQRIRAVG